MLLFVILGIVVGHNFYIEKFILLILLVVSFLLVIIFYYKTKLHTKFSIYFTLSLFLVSFSVGLNLIHFKNPLNQKSHYTQLVWKNDIESFYKLEVSIRKVLKPTLYHQKYEAEIKSINQQKCSGKILLNIIKDSTNTALEVDQQFSFFGALSSINAPKNPYTFDYQKYLQKQQIYHQSTIHFGDLIFLDTDTTILGLASYIRATLYKKLSKFNIPPNEMAVINALLLGQRQDISKDLMENYINAGAVHILAVSGLHIGIILVILQFLLSPIQRFKNGKLFKVVLLIILLWMYAVIAGLSPSIIRAVTMFSILAIGMNLNKLTNIYYTLLLSALVLLLINPYLLFEVGFQLSYAAVLSIVIFQPIFQSFWRPNNKIVLFYWNVFTVSCAAQIGVLPISLYYFHQFPGLFFLTNLLIIPFLGIILFGGILVFVLALLNSLPLFIVKAYTTLIYWMNLIVQWVGSQEQFLIKEIAFNGWMLVSVFIILILVISVYYDKSVVRFNWVLVSIIILQLINLNLKYTRENENNFVVFHKSKASVLGELSGSQLNIFSNLDSIDVVKSSYLTAYRIEKGIKKQTLHHEKNIFFIGNDSILVLNDEKLGHQLNFNPSILILSNSPKINLNRVLERIKPRLIIADGSNFISYVKNWEQSCLKSKTPFHHTGQKGAFVIN